MAATWIGTCSNEDVLAILVACPSWHRQPATTLAPAAPATPPATSAPRLRQPAMPPRPCHPPNPCSPVGWTWAIAGTPASGEAWIPIAASSIWARDPSCWAPTLRWPIPNIAGSIPFKCAPIPGAMSRPQPCTWKPRNPASTISTPIIAISPITIFCRRTPIRCSVAAWFWMNSLSTRGAR